MGVNWFRIGIGVFLVLTFLYSILFANQLLVWFYLLFLLLTAYLVYLAIRLVWAIETIAENSNTIAENLNRVGTDANE